MILVHKIALKPNKAQQVYFTTACKAAHVAYNWALAEWNKQYEAGCKPNEAALRKLFNSIKPVQFPWMLSVTKCAPQQAIKNLGTAFKNFFRRVKKGEKPGYPKFKKKVRHASFRADNGPAKKGLDAVIVNEKCIKLPKIGWVNMTEKVRFDGQIKSATVSRTANRWYVALSIETEDLKHERKSHGTVGVDVGIKDLATLSNGEKYKGVKPYRAALKRLKHLQTKFSKTKKGSKRRKKALMRLQKMHAKVANIRNNLLHKLTTDVVLNYDIIGIEDLNIKGMMKNHCLAMSIADQGFYEFKRQLEYKGWIYGSKVVLADRFFPSSKRCSVCRTINDKLTLKDRTWTCSDCGTTHDRDVNAAINLELNAVET